MAHYPLPIQQDNLVVSSTVAGRVFNNKKLQLRTIVETRAGTDIANSSVTKL
jgi:hypothetical protein